MKKNFKKNNSFRMAIAGIVIATIVFSIYVINKTSDPFDPIRDRRNYVEKHEPIKIEKKDNGIMVYSVGKVNNGADNMYFVNMVQKSLMGYKWVGGGGHINRDISTSKEFVFSAQLLNEEQNVYPTIFGVISNDKVKRVIVRTHGSKFRDAIIYDRKNEREKFYYIPLGNNVSDERLFIFTIIYENDKRKEYIISNDEASRFQDGRQIYFY